MNIKCNNSRKQTSVYSIPDDLQKADFIIQGMSPVFLSLFQTKNFSTKMSPLVTYFTTRKCPFAIRVKMNSILSQQTWRKQLN